MKISKPKRNGSALAFVMLILVIFFATGLGFMSLSLHSQLLSIRSAAEIAARSAADAGVTDAIFRMGKKIEVVPWSDATLPSVTDRPLTSANAAFSYSLTGSIDAGYTIISVGKSVRAVKTVNALIEEQSPFDYAIMVKETIALKSDTLVTGYDSSAPATTDIEIQIGSTSPDPDSIKLSPGAVVNGEILIDCDFDFAEVSTPILAPKDFPPVKGQTRTITPADSGKYPEIYVSDSAGVQGILQIDGGDVVIHVTEIVNLGTGSELLIKKGSSLTLYLDGDFISRNSSGIINEAEIPAAFQLYGTATATQTIDLKAKTDWYGAVYAPNAEIVIHATSDLYGSIVGTNFTMMNSGTVYYDTALSDVGESHFTLKRWWEQPTAAMASIPSPI